MRMHRIDVNAIPIEDVKKSKLYRAIEAAEDGRKSALSRLYGVMLKEGLYRIFESPYFQISGWEFNLTPFVEQYTFEISYANVSGSMGVFKGTCFAPSKALARKYAERIRRRFRNIFTTKVKLY